MTAPAHYVNIAYIINSCVCLPIENEKWANECARISADIV